MLIHLIKSKHTWNLIKPNIKLLCSTISEIVITFGEMKFTFFNFKYNRNHFTFYIY